MHQPQLLKLTDSLPMNWDDNRWSEVIQTM